LPLLLPVLMTVVELATVITSDVSLFNNLLEASYGAVKIYVQHCFLKTVLMPKRK
jgi:hypothetical protein